MWNQILGASLEELTATLLLVGITYLAIVLYVRITGLRSFSKMSATDFAMTVAVGSILASAADPSRSAPVLLTGLAGVFVIQWLLALLRTTWPAARDALDNEPLLLVANGTILEENLSRSRVARADLLAKLREANALNLGQVRAVVLETTGDISVLHTTDPDEVLDTDLLRDVRDGERVQGGPVPPLQRADETA